LVAGDNTPASWPNDIASGVPVDPVANTPAGTPGPGGNFDVSLLHQYAAAGFGGDDGGHATTPTPETIFGQVPPLTKPTR
jgi:hypothetical protein